MKVSKVMLIKVVVFAAIAGLMTVALGIKLANSRLFADTYELEAEFDDATGILNNDAVKLAGVDVGRVQGAEIEDGKAIVTFNIDKDVQLPKDSRVSIRWRNVLGQRFVYVYPGDDEEVYEEGDRIPVSQTDDVNDIGTFINRVGPVLKAIDPEEANAFLDAMNTALEGNEQDVRQLLDDGAKLAETLSEEDIEIKGLIRSSSKIMGAFASQDEALGGIFDNLDGVGTMLRRRINDVNTLVTEFAAVQRQLNRLVTENGDNIDASIASLDTVAGVLAKNKRNLARTLHTMPLGVASYFQTSSWGEYFNVRLIALTVQDTSSNILVEQRELDNQHGDEGGEPDTGNGGDGGDDDDDDGGAQTRRDPNATSEGIEAVLRYALDGGGVVSIFNRQKGRTSFLERNQLIIGIIAGLIVIGGSSFSLLLSSGVFNKTYKVTAYFEDAAGIKAGDDVKVAGLDAGKVGAIEIRDGVVAVELKVSESVELSSDSTAEITIETLLGRKSVTLYDGSGEALLADGDEILIDDTVTPVDLIDIADQSVRLLEESDADSLETFMSEVSKITNGKREQITTLINGLGDTLAAVDERKVELASLIDSLRIVSTTFAERDDTLVSLIDNFDVVLANLAERTQELVILLENTDSASHEVASLVSRDRSRLDSAIDGLSTALRVLDKHQLDLAGTVSYLEKAVRGYSSVGYSQGVPNRWANIFVQSLGPVGVDAALGPCGALDQALDELLGPDPRDCDEREDYESQQGEDPPPDQKAPDREPTTDDGTEAPAEEEPGLGGDIGDLLDSITGNVGLGDALEGRPVMTKRILGLLVALALVASGCSVFGGSDDDQRVIKARFSRAVQVFPGNSVRVLGVTIGRVTDVQNVEGAAEVTLRIDDPTIKLPADVEATIVPVSLLGERYIQLFPAYDGGAEFTADLIDLGRTSVPAEQDELLRGLQDYFGALDPDKVSAFVTDAATILEANGAGLNRLIEEGSSVIGTLSDKRDSLAGLIRQLNRLTVTLSTRQDAIGRVIKLVQHRGTRSYG